MTVCDCNNTIRDIMRFCLILFSTILLSKAKTRSISKGKTEMKESAEKKITSLKVFKVIVIVFTCVILGVCIHAIYSWATNIPDYNYIYLTTSVASYCATIARYEEMKKKEEKKKAN